MSISRAKRYSNKRKRVQTNSSGGRSRFKRGFYQPINEDKYREPMDKTMSKKFGTPEYRSSWELKMYKWLDHNDEVEYWTTEPLAIKYISPKDGRTHRYFPDILVKFKNGMKTLIEIKPMSQCNDPVNLAKWEQAEIFCKQNDIKWMVMTEKELGVGKYK